MWISGVCRQLHTVGTVGTYIHIYMHTYMHAHIHRYVAVYTLTFARKPTYLVMASYFYVTRRINLSPKRTLHVKRLKSIAISVGWSFFGKVGGAKSDTG